MAAQHQGVVGLADDADERIGSPAAACRQTSTRRSSRRLAGCGRRLDPSAADKAEFDRRFPIKFGPSERGEERLGLFGLGANHDRDRAEARRSPERDARKNWFSEISASGR